jgi:hypothetical protein
MSNILVDQFFPFDTGPGATATPTRWRSMARLFYGSGVVPGNQNQFSCTLTGGVLTISTGAAWIDGFYGENDAAKTLAISGNGMVVARMDPNLREIMFVFVPSQTVPTQQPTGIFEIPLYQVTGTTLTDIRQFAIATPSAIARARVYRNGAYTTPTALTNFGFDTVSYGTGFTISGTTAGTYFTCPYSADYLVSAQIVFQATAANQWYNIRLLHNGAVINWNGTPDATGSAELPCSLNDVVPCKTGDTLVCQHNCSTAGLQGVVGPSIAWMTVRALS